MMYVFFSSYQFVLLFSTFSFIGDIAGLAGKASKYPCTCICLAFGDQPKETTKWFCVTWSLNKTINKEEKYVFQASRCVILDEM